MKSVASLGTITTLLIVVGLTIRSEGHPWGTPMVTLGVVMGLITIVVGKRKIDKGD